MKRLILPVLVLLFLAGCNSDPEQCAVIPDTKDITVEVEFEHFEDSLANINTKEELVQFFSRNPMIRDFVFLRENYPNDSAFINAIHARLTNPHIDTLLMETKKVFGDQSALKKEFADAFTNITYYYPEFRAPKIQTVISGLDTDMIMTDSLIIVGLDFYLGKGAKYRPKMYEYLLRKYEPGDIVPTVVLIYGIGEKYNRTNPADKTVLADMMAYGKSYYFAKRMMPCTPDSVLISYTPEEISGSRANQDLIWARFIESEVLYSTSHMVKKDYLGERPFTVQVGEKCPGRIGQWMGWQIINKYMETHPSVTLQELMKMEDAQKLFQESRYKPERR